MSGWMEGAESLKVGVDWSRGVQCVSRCRHKLGAAYLVLVAGNGPKQKVSL